MLTLFRARLHVGLSHSRSGRFGATSASQCQHLSALLPVEQNAAATCSYGQTPQTRTSSSPRGSPQRKMGPEPRLRQCEGLRTFHTSPPTPRRGGRVRCRPVARGSGPFRLSAKRPKSGPVNTVAERNSESNRCRRNSTLRSAKFSALDLQLRVGGDKRRQSVERSVGGLEGFSRRLVVHLGRRHPKCHRAHREYGEVVGDGSGAWSSVAEG